MIFSSKWIKEKAKEILGHENISIFQEYLGKVEITVDGAEDYKFNKFQKIIKDNAPIGVKIIITRIKEVK